MIQLIIEIWAAASFAWFFAYAIEETPYLAWYNQLIGLLPEIWQKPFGICPYCSSPWFFFLIHFTNYEILVQTLFALGTIYILNCLIARIEA